MKNTALLFITIFLLTGVCFAQTKRRPVKRPVAAAKPAAPPVDKGTVAGRTYTNKTFGFQVTFPDTWLIPDDDFEAYMKSQGFDLSLKAPDSLAPATKAKMEQAAKKVNILLTAYRSMPGEPDNAIVRISTEDLTTVPQIKDAVDYFDAVRAAYAKMKLPPDFKYSATEAEQLGAMQFAYLDAESSAGKKRMYATVRGGHAVMFTLSYQKPADLETFRKMLEDGDFALKP